ncbi:hypothetical protein [Cohnella massiliensis]|nr:hypothetical protein [Cohnella massiliensis]
MAAIVAGIIACAFVYVIRESLHSAEDETETKTEAESEPFR